LSIASLWAMGVTGIWCYSAYISTTPWEPLFLIPNSPWRFWSVLTFFPIPTFWTVPTFWVIPTFTCPLSSHRVPLAVLTNWCAWSLSYFIWSLKGLLRSLLFFMNLSRLRTYLQLLFLRLDLIAVLNSELLYHWVLRSWQGVWVLLRNGPVNGSRH
jgi:hypothetical protein